MNKRKKKLEILDSFGMKTKNYTSILKLIKSQKYKISDERTMLYDSPTGRAYIGVAKKPLQEVKNGFGFKGVVVQTDNREFIQCHVCGKWFRQINKRHLAEHDLTIPEYRKKFSLFTSRALVSDSLSYSLEERGRKNIERFNLQSLEAGIARKKAAEARSKQDRTLKYTDEWNNRYAICEKQLGFRLLEYMKQFKTLPSRGQKGEGRMIAKAMFNRYGSLNDAFKHYQVPTIYRSGSSVELLASNNKQLFFNYNKNYNREQVWSWILENSPVLQAPNMFKD